MRSVLALAGTLTAALGFAAPTHAESMMWFINSFNDAGHIAYNVPAMINCDTCGIAEDLTIDRLRVNNDPSCWFTCHEEMWPAFDVIDAEHVDFVVAQDNSWRHTSTAGLESYGNQVTEWADHSKGAGGVLALEQMWIAVSETYGETHQNVSNFWYDSIAQVTHSVLVPCGYAWWIARQEQPNLEYIAPNWNDGVHPGIFGAYLNQCVFYATLTGTSPVGLDYKTTTFSDYEHTTLPDADALFAQQKAWEAYQYFYPPTTLSVTGLSASPHAAVAGQQTSVTFSVTVTCDNAITGVSIDVSTLGGPMNAAMTASGDVYSYTHTIPASVNIRGPKTVSVRANDDSYGWVLSRLKYQMTDPLALANAWSDYDDSRLVLTFTEGLDPASAENSANYTIEPGITVGSATLSADSNVVVLTTSTLATQTVYTVTINNVTDLAGSTIPANTQEAFKHFIGGDGLTATYWQSQFLTGTPKAVQVVPTIDYVAKVRDEHDREVTIEPAPGVLPYWLGVRWEGWLEVPYTGSYTFTLDVSHQTRLYIDNELVINEWDGEGYPADASPYSGTISLTEGKVPLLMEFAQRQGNPFWHLSWSSDTDIEQGQIIPQTFFFSDGTPVLATIEPVRAAVPAAQDKASVTVYDLRGREILTRSGSLSARTADLSTGVYITRVKGTGNRVVRECLVR